MLKDTIWAVMVVPMFAPIIIPIAVFNVIKPALTNPTVITEVALLLWMIMVVASPTKTEAHGFFCRILIIDLILFEVTFWRLSLRVVIPKINNIKPPRTCKINLKYINFN